MENFTLYIVFFSIAVIQTWAALPPKFHMSEDAPLQSMTTFPGSNDIIEIGEKLYIKDRYLFEEIYAQVKTKIITALKVIEKEQLMDLMNNTMSVMPSEQEMEELIKGNAEIFNPK